MKYGKIMIVVMLAIFLFCITSVCASDAFDGQLASEEASAIELSDDEEIIKENTQTKSASDGGVGVNDESEVLGGGEGTYTDLRNEIGNGGNITLTKSFYFYYSQSDGDTIRITTSGTIDGKGAVIDVAGSTIQALYVDAPNVTIKNLTFLNVNYGGNGAAIYFSGSGTVENCNFIDNTAKYGAALSFQMNSTVRNCNFTRNTAETNDGGAILFNGSGVVDNCNFIKNSASVHGGALYFATNGNVKNSNFINNTAEEFGGAVRISRGGETCLIVILSITQ